MFAASIFRVVRDNNWLSWRWRHQALLHCR